MARVTRCNPNHCEPAHVVIVDDQPLVRERLTELLDDELGLVVRGEAENRCQALEVIAQRTPDLAIMGLALKESEGLELIKDINTRWPRLVMLVLSMHADSSYAERALRAGARGFVSKREATQRIVQAVRHVLEGGIYLSETHARQIAERSVNHGRPNHRPAPDVLSDREFQVLFLMGEGHPTTRIAERLSLHESTVETYQARIKEKLGLKDAIELRQYAIRWGRLSD